MAYQWRIFALPQARCSSLKSSSRLHYRIRGHLQRRCHRPLGFPYCDRLYPGREKLGQWTGRYVTRSAVSANLSEGLSLRIDTRLRRVPASTGIRHRHLPMAWKTGSDNSTATATSRTLANYIAAEHSEGQAGISLQYLENYEPPTRS